MISSNTPILESASNLPLAPAAPSFCRLTEWGFLRVSGEDAASFLQGQATCDINILTDGRLGSGAFCTPKGRVIASFRIAKSENTFFLLLAQELVPVIHKRLQLYVMRSRVKLEDLSNQYHLIGGMGPGIEAALDLAEQELPRTQGLTWSKERRLGVMKISDKPFRCLLLVDANHSGLQERFSRFQSFHADEWKRGEIEAGFPWVTAETTEEFLPQMLNLDRLGGIGFNKGCYTGQEIVTRTHFLGQLKRRMLLLFGASTTVPAAGSTIFDEAEGAAKPVGQIVNASGDAHGQFTCLAVIGLDFADSQHLRIDDPTCPGLKRMPLPYSLTD
jgi:hypothetical protein